MTSLAETYDRVSDLQFETGKALVERLELEPGARLLDVGCGTGRLAQWMTERGIAVTGIDPGEERIRIARSRTREVRFEVGEAEDLHAFEDASFDAVCMSSVLHWVADKPTALAEARRVLRPGGRLGVTTSPQELAKAGTIGNVLETLLARYAGRIDRSMLTVARGCTITELVSLVIDSQLDLAELNVLPRAHTFASGEAVVELIEASAFGTFLRRIAEDLRPVLRADLVAAFDARRDAEGVAARGWDVRFVATRV